MAEVRFHKVATLPAVLEPNAWYMVENGNYSETYVTNSSSIAKMVGNSTMINQLISAALTGLNSTEIVANITARNALGPTLNRNALVYVVDATGDTTVSGGAASYLWDDANSIWIKITEFESLDASISWSSISGKPSSTPGAIDAAVSNSHTHSNKVQLDKIGEDANGVATYNGDQIKNWNTVNW